MKTLKLSQTEINDNAIQVRLEKFSSDGDSLGWHRTAIETGGDIDAQFAAVNAHLGSQGYASVSAEDIATVKTIASSVWTAEVVAAYQARISQQNGS
jgi:hypothetical protein